MTKKLERPEGLPDFDNPPINEVVLGVQFTPPAGYQQIRAGEVWSLFKDNYPRVEEQIPLPPQFETFGVHQQQRINFGLVTGGQHDRFWFLSENGELLLQFQIDRLLHNWRKVGDETNPYPHFEAMVNGFESELRKFETYVSSLQTQVLNCNQAEVSYINHIVHDENDKVSDWFNTVNDRELNAENMSVTYNRTVTDDKGQPWGRLYSEVIPAFKRDGTRILALNLTVRGAPASPDIPASLDFMKKGREVIVNEFAKITTESAHRHWSRIQ